MSWTSQNNVTQDTEWIVITGAPSSGKTSVINDLKARGYQVQDEVAREYIEACISRGLSLQEIRADGGVELQRQILRLKLAREAVLPPDEIVFLDRGVPDSMTYFRLAGLDVAAAQEASARFRYDAVFIFDRLPVVPDGVRVEDEIMAGEIDQMLMQDYRSLGYDPVRVPVMPIAKRTDFILNFLQLPVNRPVTA